MGLNRPSRAAMSEGKPKMLAPIIVLSIRAARLHRPIVRTKPRCCSTKTLTQFAGCCSGALQRIPAASAAHKCLLRIPKKLASLPRFSLPRRGAALLRPSSARFVNPWHHANFPLLQFAHRHAVKLRAIPHKFPYGLPRRHPRRRLLDNRSKWSTFSRRERSGGRNQHRSRRSRNRSCDGEAIRPNRLRPHHAISLRPRRKTGAPPPRSRPAEFSLRRARVFHLRRLRSHRNRRQARPAISSRKRSTRALSRRFPPSELSRQHARRDDRQRQCHPPRPVSAATRRVGTHRPLLLLSLPLRQKIPRLRRRMRKRPRQFSEHEWRRKCGRLHLRTHRRRDARRRPPS